MHPFEAQTFADFLLPMLALDPTRRATAKNLLLHPWLRMSSCDTPIPIDTASKNPVLPPVHMIFDNYNLDISIVNRMV